jgi:DNA-binding NarL/FixJ family response regulator
MNLGRRERLRPRQQEVLRLLCKGLRNAEIGAQLGISERSVKGYVSQLFLIFEVSNRTELAGLIGDTFASGNDEPPVR